MSLRSIFFGVLCLAGLPLTSAACGICIEDKVAATYDDAIVTKAARDNRAVAFFEIVGVLPQETRVRQSVVESIESVRGVERGTVRWSSEPAALSFATDVHTFRLEDTMKGVNQKLAHRQLRLTLLQIFYKSKLQSPAPDGDPLPSSP